MLCTTPQCNNSGSVQVRALWDLIWLRRQQNPCVYACCVCVAVCVCCQVISQCPAAGEVVVGELKDMQGQVYDAPVVVLAQHLGGRCLWGQGGLGGRFQQQVECITPVLPVGRGRQGESQRHCTHNIKCSSRCSLRVSTTRLFLLRVQCCCDVGPLPHPTPPHTWQQA